jgi:hypothetical protein
LQSIDFPPLPHFTGRESSHVVNSICSKSDPERPSPIYSNFSIIRTSKAQASVLTGFWPDLHFRLRLSGVDRDRCPIDRIAGSRNPLTRNLKNFGVRGSRLRIGAF